MAKAKEKLNMNEYVNVPTFYKCLDCGAVYSSKTIEGSPLGTFLFRKRDSVMVACPSDDCRGMEFRK